MRHCTVAAVVLALVVAVHSVCAQPFRTHPFVSTERLEAIEKAVREKVAAMSNLQKAKNLDMVCGFVCLLLCISLCVCVHSNQSFALHSIMGMSF